jgi:hypothetical protein
MKLNLRSSFASFALCEILSSIVFFYLLQLRRGTDRADIHCIVFSPDSKWLAVSSDKATVHVFRVADSADLASSTTPQSGAEQKLNAPEEGGQAAPAAAPPAESLPASASLPGAKASKGSSLSFLKGT